jgi:hypothetical protein
MKKYINLVSEKPHILQVWDESEHHWKATPLQEVYKERNRLK